MKVTFSVAPPDVTSGEKSAVGARTEGGPPVSDCTSPAARSPVRMAPITVGPRAEEVLRNRRTPVQSWYFDLTTTMSFWGKDRTYHHTPPISIVFALREALRIVFEEGLEVGWRRHRQNQLALIAGLEALGLDVASESALVAGLVMGVMIVPFVSSLSDDVISAVPQTLRGEGPWETSVKYLRDMGAST